MKKTALIVVSMLTVVVLAMTALVGCGETPDSLAGTTWKVTHVKGGGIDMSVDDFLKMQGMSGEMVFEFSADKVDAKVNGESMGTSASYTYDKGTITIDGPAGKVEGSKMTFEIEGMTLELQKK